MSENTIDAQMYCAIPYAVDADDCHMMLTKRGQFRVCPRIDEVIATPDRDGLCGERSAPGIEVVGVEHDPNGGPVTIMCSVVNGDEITIGDMLCIDGWEMASEEGCDYMVDGVVVYDGATGTTKLPLGEGGH